MNGRATKTCCSKPGLCQSDIKLPRQAKRRQKDIHRVQNCSEENKLYRLKVLEEDANNSLVKVRYIGYSSTYNEWRLKDEIVQLSDAESSSEENDCSESPA